MKSVVREGMIGFEAAVWAKARIVRASFAIVDTSVPSTTCRMAAHDTFPLLALAQEMEPPIQPLWIPSILNRPLPGTANSRTWGSRRDIPGSQSFNDRPPVSYMR